MSKQANGLQSTAEKVSDSPLCACGEGVIATEFSAAATPAGFWDTLAGARDRALAGLSSI